MKKQPKTDINPREQTVLFAIGDRAMYGTEIQGRIEEFDPGSGISIGALYALLDSLEKKQLIHSVADSDLKRKCYSLTEEGFQKVQSIFDTNLDLLGEDFFLNRHRKTFS